MPDPSTLMIPEKRLVVVFVEIPYGSGPSDSFFVPLDENPACHRMKEVFPSLVHITDSGDKCKIYEWVSSMALLHCLINCTNDSSLFHMSWKMMLYLHSSGM